MGIVMNGFSSNTMNVGSKISPGQVWLYDTVTGLNVVSGSSSVITPGDFSLVDFNQTDFSTGATTVTVAAAEYLNLSQFPGTFGFTSS